MGASNAGDNPPLPNQVKDTLPLESTILTQTTTSQETPIVVENPPSWNRFLTIFFLFLGGFFIIFAFHAPPELEGPPSFFLAMMCLAVSLFFEISNPQQPKIDKTKLGEPTKSETNTQINPFTLILVVFSTLLFLFFCFFILPVLLFILSHSS